MAEDRYLQLFQGIPVGMFVWDGIARKLDVNPALARICGYDSPAAMAARPAPELVAGQPERDRFVAALRRDGQVVDFLCLTAAADGTTLWLSVDARAVIREGRMERLEGVARDVTAQVTAEAELTRTREHFASLVQDAPILFASVDSDMRITHVAGNVLRDAGLTPGTMVGRPVADFFPGRPEILEHFNRALRGDTFSCPGHLANRQFHVHYRPACDATGAVDGAVMVAVDVTERAEAEAVAELSRERLAAVLASTPIVLATTDPAGVFNYVAGNIMVELGIDPDARVGVSYQDYFADDPGIREWWARALAGEAHTQELRVHDRVYVTYFFPLYRDGVSVGASMVGMDITERMMAQQQAAARARYQTAVIQVGASALQRPDHDHLLQEALVSIARVLDLPLAAAFELQPEHETATVSAVVSDVETGASPGQSFPLEQLTSYHTLISSGNPAAIEDYEAQPEFFRDTLLKDLGVRASLSALIPGEVRPLGVIALFSRVPRKWTGYELEFVQIMGNMLSVSLQRSRAETQRKLLLARLVGAQEEERRSIANDIHDDAVQVMTAANMRLEIFRRQLGDVAENEAVNHLQTTVSLAIQRLRHLLFELSPPALERYGLVAAIRMALDQLRSSTDLEVVLDGELKEEPEIARRTLVYRVFQEAMANIRKHSQATAVHVSIRPEGGGLAVTIADNGAGFAVARVENPRPGHLGITAMRERMELAGGSIKIVSEPGAGTQVRLWMPA